MDALNHNPERGIPYISIQQMERLYPDRKFKPRVLDATATLMGVKPVLVHHDEPVPTLHYRADVWHRAYSIELPAPA